ncbi:urea amidohydrolase [Rhodococcus sp. Eu-32]|uniref:urea amidohydrolase n=1 Tax=Rhodococcus sp. Eu-32 TaxID=1017319 RepID=UPI000DF488DC|nr:urea amidohydrolase [Rhodococcus sp. Eu-32]RRQ25329.1 urea amidohydrolase [Rhodococcus sp. Eu-32]
MNDDEQQRRCDAILRARLDAADVAGLDADEIDDLAAGRDVDDALNTGQSISEAAATIGHTDAVATDLRNRFRTFRDGLAARDQITLF